MRLQAWHIAATADQLRHTLAGYTVDQAHQVDLRIEERRAVARASHRRAAAATVASNLRHRSVAEEYTY